MFSKKQLNNFWNKVNKKSDNECWEWTATLTKHGYGMVKYNNKNVSAHRMSYMIHNNKYIDDGKHILHSCDNRKCINPLHLREGTHRENMLDKKIRGREVLPERKCGEEHHNSKLTEDIVKVIKARFETEVITHTQLAKEYGVGRATISDIIKGRTWANTY